MCRVSFCMRHQLTHRPAIAQGLISPDVAACCGSKFLGDAFLDYSKKQNIYYMQLRYIQALQERDYFWEEASLGILHLNNLKHLKTRQPKQNWHITSPFSQHPRLFGVVGWLEHCKPSTASRRTSLFNLRWLEVKTKGVPYWGLENHPMALFQWLHLDVH